MHISRNEFDTLSEALQAIVEFPYCGTCKAGVKVAQINGRTLMLCSRRPEAHFGFGIKRTPVEQG